MARTKSRGYIFRYLMDRKMENCASSTEQEEKKNRKRRRNKRMRKQKSRKPQYGTENRKIMKH